MGQMNLPHQYTALAQILLRIANAELAEVKNRSSQHGAGVTLIQRLVQMFQRPRPT